MDRMMRHWQDYWPALEMPRHSLLGQWRKKYGADEVLALTENVGLTGKDFAASADLIRYLAGALAKNAVRRSQQKVAVAQRPLAIATALGDPITDPDERLACIRQLKYDADPDQGQWFTIPDAVVRTGEMDEETRQAILGKLPHKDSEGEARS